MSFAGDRARRLLRYLTVASGVIYVLLFIAMAVESQRSGTKPTLHWFALVGPFIVVAGLDHVANAEFHSARQRGTWVEQSPDFYAVLGLVVMVIGGGLIIAGLVNWFWLPWFE